MDFRSQNPAQYRLGLTLAFGSLLLAGTYNSLAKGLTPFLSPMTLLILSEGLTAFFILMTFGLVPLLKEFTKLDGKTIRMAIIVGLLNSALAPLLWFTGLARTSAVNASMLSCADILCILFFGHWILHEKVSRIQIMGASVILTGILIINVFSPGVTLSVHVGDLFVLSGALVSGTGAVLFKKYLSHIMPELAILIRNFVGIITVLVMSVALGHYFVQEVTAFPVRQVLALLAFGFFSRYLDLTFFYEALDRLPTTTLSLILIANPLSGLLFAMLILGESVTSYQALGGIFIVFGLILEQCSKHALQSIRSRWSLFRLPHLHRNNQVATDPIVMIPRHM